MKDRWAIVIPTKGEPVMLLHCDDGEGLSLETLQNLVEGHIETTQTIFGPYKRGERPVLIVNEEGKINDCKYNRIATEASYAADMIFGNAVLMCAKGEELVGFRKEHAERIINEWLL